MSRVSITALLTLYVCTIFGQQLFNAKSKIVVLFNAKNQTYFKHELVKGQGVKGLPQLVKKTAKEILVFNGINTEKPSFKNDIMVPLDLSLLIKSDKDRLMNKGGFAMKVPVYYKVRKGETLFKIAKSYNGEDIEQFMNRNKLKDNQIKPGMELLLGWLAIQKSTSNITPMAPDIQTKAMKTMATKDHKETLVKISAAVKEGPSVNLKSSIKPIDKDTMKRVFLTSEEEEERRKKEEQYISSRGVAIWQQSHRKNNNRFVLHDKAPINSIIYLYNPMLKKSISAKVIGRIPQETYHDDIDIVLSSGAANSLGALDTRFMIDMKYKQ